LVPKPPFRLQRGVTPEPSANLEVIPSPGASEWRIDLGAYSFAWPEGFELTDDPGELSPFLLAGPRGALIWVAGPLARDQVMPIEKLVDEDQRVRAVADAGDGARIDIDYVVDAEPWWQRRYVRFVPAEPGGPDRALVLSAQARAADEDAVREAIDLVERTLALTGGARA